MFRWVNDLQLMPSHRTMRNLFSRGMQEDCQRGSGVGDENHTGLKDSSIFTFSRVRFMKALVDSDACLPGSREWLLE